MLVSAPALQQTRDGKSYAFTGWADAAPATRTISVGDVAVAYTAMFAEVKPAGEKKIYLPVTIR